MNEEILIKRLDSQDEILGKIYKSTEKTRKYFLWTLIISVSLFILPLIGMIFVIPMFLSTYTSTLGI